MFKNEWDSVGDAQLVQTVELEGLEVNVTFTRDQGQGSENAEPWDYYLLRVWPVVPAEAAGQIDLPDELRALVGERARIGNTWGGDLSAVYIALELTQQVESLAARFDVEKGMELVSNAKLKEDEE